MWPFSLLHAAHLNVHLYTVQCYVIHLVTSIKSTVVWWASFLHWLVLYHSASNRSCTNIESLHFDLLQSLWLDKESPVICIAGTSTSALCFNTALLPYQTLLIAQVINGVAFFAHARSSGWYLVFTDYFKDPSRPIDNNRCGSIAWELDLSQCLLIRQPDGLLFVIVPSHRIAHARNSHVIFGLQ